MSGGLAGLKKPQDCFIRRLPIGAEPQPGGEVHFRVWAPRSKRVAVLWQQTKEGPESRVELNSEAGGYFSGFVAEARAGAVYKLCLDRGAFPDPASRFQPDGVHGSSQVIDPLSFVWSDAAWRGVQREGQVMYEMHIGTFTPEGTWRAAMAELPELAQLGVTIIEVMPVGEFPGRFGWGYDGVDIFAPKRLYGSPDDMRAFVDRAHAVGIGVILDVVYNHFGPDGNYLREFSEQYMSTAHSSEWGEAPNFDCGECHAVREFVTSNAAYWIDEFHLDGLRLDATQQIFDDSEDHIITAIVSSARAAGKGRSVYIIGENELQEAKLARTQEAGGHGLDALWNDDLHHSAMVALTGRSEAYYSDYRGSPQEFISAAKWGFLFQGQRYKWQSKRRGTSGLDLPPCAFVTFLQNHDQVANSLRGARVHELTTPGRLRAMSAYLLLGPGTPLLFQGQEFGASAPFLYFAEHDPELAALVAQGRQEFLRQFPSITGPGAAEMFPRPESEETFLRCKLDLAERETHSEVYRLHRDLLRLRREDAVLRDAGCEIGGSPFARRFDGAVLAGEAFVLRYFGPASDDRLLVVNLGRDLHLDPAPEPLLAPPEGALWETKWSSESTIYGGGGTSALDSDENWRIPGHAAVLLAPERFMSTHE